MGNWFALARSISSHPFIQDLPVVRGDRHFLFISDRKPKPLGNFETLPLGQPEERGDGVRRHMGKLDAANTSASWSSCRTAKMSRFHQTCRDGSRFTTRTFYAFSDLCDENVFRIVRFQSFTAERAESAEARAETASELA